MGKASVFDSAGFQRSVLVFNLFSGLASIRSWWLTPTPSPSATGEPHVNDSWTHAQEWPLLGAIVSFVLFGYFVRRMERLKWKRRLESADAASPAAQAVASEREAEVSRLRAAAVAWKATRARLDGYASEFSALVERAEVLCARRGLGPPMRGGQTFSGLGATLLDAAAAEDAETAKLWDEHRRVSVEADAMARGAVSLEVCRELLPPLDHGSEPPDLDVLRAQIETRRDAFRVLAARVVPAVREAV